MHIHARACTHIPGKKAITWLEEYTAKASERADQLAQSQVMHVHVYMLACPTCHACHAYTARAS